MVVTPAMLCHHQLVNGKCGSCGADSTFKYGASPSNFAASSSSSSSSPAINDNVSISTGAFVLTGVRSEPRHKEEKNLIRQKKLVLLVDLDHTLVHTVSGKRLKEKDVSGDVRLIKMKDGETQMYTQARPRARELLRQLVTYYELYVCTFGSRSYTYEVTHFLDPGGEFIKPENILCRDDFPQRDSKVAVLGSRFQNVTHMVVIIDDRHEVWDHADNLIAVHPYYRQNACNEEDDEDDDEQLLYLLDHLKLIHDTYYDHIRKHKTIPSTQELIVKLKRCVMENVKIVLSCINPNRFPAELSVSMRLAKEFGANVEKHVTRETYCVVAGDPQTDKCQLAAKLNVPVVHANWLGCCIERWEIPSRRLFVLTRNNKPTLKLESGEVSIFQKPGESACNRDMLESVDTSTIHAISASDRTSEPIRTAFENQETGNEVCHLAPPPSDDVDSAVEKSICDAAIKQPVTTIINKPHRPKMRAVVSLCARTNEYTKPKSVQQFQEPQTDQPE